MNLNNPRDFIIIVSNLVYQSLFGFFWFGVISFRFSRCFFWSFGFYLPLAETYALDYFDVFSYKNYFHLTDQTFHRSKLGQVILILLLHAQECVKSPAEAIQQCVKNFIYDVPYRSFGTHLLVSNCFYMHCMFIV